MSLASETDGCLAWNCIRLYLLLTSRQAIAKTSKMITDPRLTPRMMGMVKVVVGAELGRTSGGNGGDGGGAGGGGGLLGD